MNRTDRITAVRAATAREEPRMGSEYADARTYLGRVASTPRVAARRKTADDSQHGMNDSDFGIPDPRET